MPSFKRVGLLFALGGTLMASLLGLRDAVRQTPPRSRYEAPDLAMRAQRRYAEARKFLANVGLKGGRALGYRAHCAEKGEPSQAERETAAWLAAQFALVPWTLRGSESEAWLLVDFIDEPVDAKQFPAGFRVVQDFGTGVVLLTKGTEAGR